ncbi:1-acyl-sn-glycerol-3-phosphate acyltransferase, partial [Cutibacterium acnes]|nr:1-acyl-sn-glycerol-3-phosphate acyltransferase [Cutibacterium acnes]
VREATNRIMDAIDAKVARVRGEFPPPDRYDMRKGARIPKSIASARPVVDPH